MNEEGASHQEYLYNLLSSEVASRRETRIEKYLNTAGFPRRYEARQFRTDEVEFLAGVNLQSLLELD